MQLQNNAITQKPPALQMVSF